MIEPRTDITLTEFLAWEKEQIHLHELINGRIVPFVSGSADHELITGNVFAKLHASVEPPCLVFLPTTIIETSLRTGKDGYRPDVTVSCSKANVGNIEYIEKPRIVVEVVSPSNYGKPWSEKLFEYWRTESIEQLVLIDSQERAITSYLRDAGGIWMPPIDIQVNGTLDFPPISVKMSFSKIYANTSISI